MGKEEDAPTAQGSLVGSDSPGPASDHGAEKTGVHQFNEQTNYVPKRTIITVGGPVLSSDSCAETDSV